ncbi:SDR family NAD(P)-dependent oxidoreductase [Mangrovibrevibacter kandeliae]|uniref:SDR family NAD(P)-dependent oxidoreductase n=1 Tax=Mangrovibrevibacter kandeliae TaxID=2968473 RepID=UPI002118E479|nr:MULTISPECIES: SDR family oxidoreductase [unclassified Aurantimonas]MCQ8784087.1 SDR family oxidoreductase [Aurantimonas sp. CSK15Z-1]MCW4116806.1 SDR family oxidoreductase [Aurantimonas sp. MSK8Z-1]
MSQSRSTALVTGASSGIGAAYADRLARRGHDLVLVARDAARLQTLAARLRSETGAAVDILPADLTKPADLAALEERLRQDGRIGLLVNNAGAVSPGGFAAEDLQPLYTLVDLNVTALTRLAGAAVQGFLAHGRGGAIVNLGSVVGFAPELFAGVYGATKAYVLALSQAMNAELAGKNIYVQAVLPSGTKTEIWERSGRATDDWMMDVDDLVDAALVGFDRREAVTIPPFEDAALFDTYETARKALLSQFRASKPATRYRT